MKRISMISKEERKAKNIWTFTGTILGHVFFNIVLAWLFIFAFDWLAVQAAWDISIPKTFSCSAAVAFMLWCVRS